MRQAFGTDGASTPTGRGSGTRANVLAAAFPGLESGLVVERQLVVGVVGQHVRCAVDRATDGLRLLPRAIAAAPVGGAALLSRGR